MIKIKAYADHNLPDITNIREALQLANRLQVSVELYFNYEFGTEELSMTICREDSLELKMAEFSKIIKAKQDFIDYHKAAPHS